MIRKKNLVVTVVCVIAAALILGFIYDAVITAVERSEHPLSYSAEVKNASQKYGVPEALIYTIIKSESGFDPNAISKVGAVGLMQLMPSTFEDLTENFLGENLPESALYDPATNISYGVYYLSWLYSKFENWETVTAAYNIGLGTVYAWLADPSCSDDGVILKHIPADETRAYVRKVTSAKETYERLYFT